MPWLQVQGIQLQAWLLFTVYPGPVQAKQLGFTLVQGVPTYRCKLWGELSKKNGGELSADKICESQSEACFSCPKMPGGGVLQATDGNIVGNQALPDAASAADIKKEKRRQQQQRSADRRRQQKKDALAKVPVLEAKLAESESKREIDAYCYYLRRDAASSVPSPSVDPPEMSFYNKVGRIRELLSIDAATPIPAAIKQAKAAE